jgi:hypothetical protein
MKILVESLLALQNLMLPPTPSTPEKEAMITELRKLVPPPVLSHFDRLVVRGKKSVALVRHGVCTECHIRVPVGTLASLITPHDVYLCDSCSCYLLLPVEEVPADLVPARTRPVVRSTRAKKAAPAIVPMPAAGR